MVTKENIIHLARLARVRVDDAEMDSLSDGMCKILAFVDELSELDSVPVCVAVDHTNICYEREDVLDNHECDVLSNAPCLRDDMYVVPAAINSGE